MNKALSTELDLHGVAIDNDKAYIIETKTNSIGIYNLKNNLERIDEIRFSPENDDVCHVNDLYIANDKLYVSMFSYPPRKNSLSFANKTYQGVILEYSLQERKWLRFVMINYSSLTAYFIMIIRCFIVFQVNS